MGHPSYKFYDDWNVYKTRCLQEDPGGAKLVFPEPEEEIIDLELYVSQLKDVEGTETSSKTDIEDSLNDIEDEATLEKEEEEYIKKDPIRKT